MLTHPQHILALLASTSLLVAAAPAPEAQIETRNIDDLVRLGLPVGEDPKTYAKRSTIQRRADQNSFHGALPGCDKRDDPSYATGASRYKDGDGTQMKTGLCDNHIYTGGWHCWYVGVGFTQICAVLLTSLCRTDLYYVNVQVRT